MFYVFTCAGHGHARHVRVTMSSLPTTHDHNDSLRCSHINLSLLPPIPQTIVTFKAHSTALQIFSSTFAFTLRKIKPKIMPQNKPKKSRTGKRRSQAQKDAQARAAAAAKAKRDQAKQKQSTVNNNSNRRKVKQEPTITVEEPLFEIPEYSGSFCL